MESSSLTLLSLSLSSCILELAKTPARWYSINLDGKCTLAHALQLKYTDTTTVLLALDLLKYKTRFKTIHTNEKAWNAFFIDKEINAEITKKKEYSTIAMVQVDLFNISSKLATTTMVALIIP